MPDFPNRVAPDPGLLAGVISHGKKDAVVQTDYRVIGDARDGRK
jgi:hypothetical protein